MSAPLTAEARRRSLRRRLRLRLGRPAKAAIALALLGAVGAGGYELWTGVWPRLRAAAQAELRETMLASSAALGLTVEEIFVEGRTETPVAHVLGALDTARGAPILSFSPGEAKAALETLPWVRSAAVERRLPGAVHVRLVERKPLALWQRDGRLALVDRDGQEIRDVDIARFRHLIVLAGEDAPRHAVALLAILDGEPALARRVSGAVRVGGRRWNLRLEAPDSGGKAIEVQLPETNPAAAWARLAELDRQNALFDRAVQAVDLRLPDRTILRMAPDNAAPVLQPPAPARGVRPQRPT